jgi:membrane-bound lytic murein transglycosylase F
MIIRERTGVVVLGGAVVLAIAVATFFKSGGAKKKEKFPWDHAWVDRDWAAIQQDTLRVLVLRDPLSWEERPKAVSGLEFELIERFANQQDIPLKAIPVDHPDSMLLALQQGRGDVIAAQFTTGGQREKWVSLSRPYHMVRPMLAQLREDPLPNKDGTIAETDTILLSAWSPFSDAFDRIRTKGVHLGTDATPEELLMQVLIGTVRSAVVTDAHASHEARRFPAIEFSEIEGPEKELCFAVRKNSPELRKKLDAWIAAPEEKELRSALIGAYMERFPKAGALRRRSMVVDPDSISPYDDAFRKNGAGAGFEWQLLVAMAWKETRFDSSLVSTQGAHGILQFMPGTAARFGLDSTKAVADHIRAAKRYVGRLDTLWMRAVPDRGQRLRFVLASYNAGPGHIIDAQRLAERLGLDPKLWEHNVERAVQLLAKPRYYTQEGMRNGYCRGEQVFHYVRDVTAIYNQLLASTGKASSKRTKPKPEEGTTVVDPPDSNLRSALPKR